jgi:hypothetical protein
LGRYDRESAFGGARVTQLYLERKTSGKCTRCGADAGETNLCEPHRHDLNARVRQSLRRTRALRRTARVLAGSTTAAA